MRIMKAIIADKGKILTDGTAFSDTVFVPEGESIDGITEITEEEHNELMRKDYATIEDYKAALAKLGVL